MSEEKHEIRERFRAEVLARDRHRCMLCGRSGVPLDVHHIIPRKLMPGGGYVPENGITLCAVRDGDGRLSCHERAEGVLDDILSGRRKNPRDAAPTPDALFGRIGSSWIIALAAAAKAAKERGE